MAPRETPRLLAASRVTALLLAVLVLAELASAQRARGMAVGESPVSSNGQRNVIVFDADTNTILNSIPFVFPSGVPDDVGIIPGTGLGAVSLSRGVSLRDIWLVDLMASPPDLAGGTNPIVDPALQGSDFAVDPQGRFLIVASSNKGNSALAVVDVATRRVVHTFPDPDPLHSVTIGRDGSVLVASFTATNVRRLVLSPTGELSDTGEVLVPNLAASNPALGPDWPSTTYVFPGGRVGATLTIHGWLTTFTLPGLTPIAARRVPKAGFSCAVVPARDGSNLLFARTGLVSAPALQAMDYHPILGTLGSTRWTSGFPNGYESTYKGGMEWVAVHPKHPFVYTCYDGGIEVRNTQTGMVVKRMPDPTRLIAATTIAVGTIPDASPRRQRPGLGPAR